MIKVGFSIWFLALSAGDLLDGCFRKLTRRRAGIFVRRLRSGQVFHRNTRRLDTDRSFGKGGLGSEWHFRAILVRLRGVGYAVVLELGVGHLIVCL